MSKKKIEGKFRMFRVIIRTWLGINKIATEVHDLRALVRENSELFKQNEALKSILQRKNK